MKIEILKQTDKYPLSTIGEMLGVCYGSNTTSPEKNYGRGLRAIESGHYRGLEYAHAYFTITGASARVIREFYTHIGGAPTRTQASTRYIDYQNFDYYLPKSIQDNPDAQIIYREAMNHTRTALMQLDQLKIPREDLANLLPLGMNTVVSCCFNARTLMTMNEQRLCNRTYIEFRELIHLLDKELSNYSDEWRIICENFYKCKCDKLMYCPEYNGCGKWPPMS